MSVFAREEAAAPMRVVSCESLQDALNAVVDGERASEVSTLLIRLDDAATNVDTFLQVLEVLRTRKVELPGALLRLRRSIVQGQDQNTQQQARNSQHGQASASTSQIAPIALRRLEMSNLDIGCKASDAVAEYLQGNAALAILVLKSCGLLPSIPSTMQRLSHAVNMSSLRVLELSNNPIGTRSMVALLDNLDTPCLHRLVLSMTMLKINLAADQEHNPLWLDGDQDWRQMDRDAVWKGEVRRVGESLANLISGNGLGGRAPRLAMLLLNANDLGWKAVKRIVSAVLDGNRSLTVVELFATTTTSEVESEHEDDGEEDQAEQRGSSRGGSRLTRSSSISDLYLRNRRSTHSSTQHQGHATPPRNGQHITERRHSNVHEDLTLQNWRFQLGRYLWENRIHRTAVKDASRYMLPTARVLSCKCRMAPLAQSGKRSVFFPFTDLPPEIRRKILEHLDQRGTLSRQQIERVISFASDPATLGYGSKRKDVGLSTAALQQMEDEVQGRLGQTDYGLLPHQRWSWSTTLKDFSMPRDWPATLLDLGTLRASTDEDEEHPDIQGLGGGGPDGYGGITMDRIGPDSARRKWLDEQSGLQAYWDII